MKKIEKHPLIPKPLTTNTTTFYKAERTIILGHSGSGKTYLMNTILNKLNLNDIYVICRNQDRYLDEYVNQSTEIKPLKDYQNKTVIFDNVFCSPQSGEIDQFCTRSRHQNIKIYYISQSWCDVAKNTIRNNCSVVMMSKQTFNDIVSLYSDVNGLDMDKKEWRELCSKAWSIPHNFIQVNKIADISQRYSFRNVNDPVVIYWPRTLKPF